MVNGMTNQADHRAVGLATLDAARDAGNRWIFPELIAEEGLEPWGGVRFILVAGNGTPSHGVDVSGERLQRGIESLRAHAQYTTRPRPRRLRPGAVPDLVRDAGRSRPWGSTSAVLFDVHWIVPPGPPPWVAAESLIAE